MRGGSKPLYLPRRRKGITPLPLPAAHRTLRVDGCRHDRTRGNKSHIGNKIMSWPRQTSANQCYCTLQQPIKLSAQYSSSSGKRTDTNSPFKSRFTMCPLSSPHANHGTHIIKRLHMRYSWHPRSYDTTFKSVQSQ